MFIEAGDNNKLIYFEFEFENIGVTDTSVGFYDFDCYADGYEARNSMCTADNAMTSIANLSPGRKMGGIVVLRSLKMRKISRLNMKQIFGYRIRLFLCTNKTQRDPAMNTHCLAEFAGR